MRGLPARFMTERNTITAMTQAMDVTTPALGVLYRESADLDRHHGLRITRAAGAVAEDRTRRGRLSRESRVSGSYLSDAM